MSIKITVIIPTWRRKDILNKLLENLKKQTFSKDNFEVLIIDSNSKDGTKELIDEYIEKINLKLIESEVNAQGVKRNIGAMNANGGILLFLDDDVVPDFNLLSVYYDCFKKKEKKTVYLGISLFSIEKEKKSNFFKYRNQRSRKILKFQRSVPSKNFVSMNFAIKKTDFFEIGMFDERYTNYGGEDHDFPCRMIEKGFKAIVVRDAKSEHCEPASSLFTRMKKIYVSGNRGFKPLRKLQPSFFKTTQLEYFESDISKISLKGKIIKLIFNMILIFNINYLLARFLYWSDSYRLLYFQSLFRVLFASVYFEGVKDRKSKSSLGPKFSSWHFWKVNN